MRSSGFGDPVAQRIGMREAGDPSDPRPLGYGRLLGVVDLGLELPVALAFGAGRVERVDRDDQLARVAVRVEREVAEDGLVGDVGRRCRRRGRPRGGAAMSAGSVAPARPSASMTTWAQAKPEPGVAGGVDAVLGLVAPRRSRPCPGSRRCRRACCRSSWPRRPARLRNESLVPPLPSLMPSGPTNGTSPRPTCWAARRIRAPPVAVTPPK